MGKTVENSQFRRMKDNDKRRLRAVTLPERTTPATEARRQNAILICVVLETKS